MKIVVVNNFDVLAAGPLVLAKEKERSDWLYCSAGAPMRWSHGGVGWATHPDERPGRPRSTRLMNLVRDIACFTL